MKKLEKYINTYLAFILLLPLCAGLFSSCSDNPVIVSNKTLDSARYNWKVDGLQAWIMSSWATDTNNIYFMDIYNQDLIKYNGISYLRYNFTFDFSAWCMNGVSNNEIYIGGYDNREPEPSFGKPQIKVWNGSIFKTINIPDTFNYYSYVKTIYTGAPGIIWLGTNKGRVLKMQSNYIEETYIDTAYCISNFLKDTLNRLYFVAVRDSSNPNHTQGKYFVNLFRYEVNSWAKIYSWIFENELPLIPLNLGSEIVTCGRDAFYKFSENGYIRIFDIYGFLAGTPEWSGLNNSDVMCLGSKLGGQGLCGYIFHWNGKKWSDENVNLYYCLHTLINVQGKYICTASNISNECFVYHGTLK